jgi:AraC-like DNA-binding protein
MFSRATIGENHIVVGRIDGVAPGSRWCGIDLKPGMVFAYGPEAEHTAVNPVGVSFRFATVVQQELAAIADERRRRFTPPPPGQVHVLDATADTGSVARQLGRYVDEVVDGQMATNELDQRLLDAIAVALSDDRRSERVGAAKRIDPRRVTGSCIEYAHAIGRIPSITELCLVAHVSERALRRAFNDIYGASPAAFFRAWALEEARRRLKSVGSDGQVSRVALDVGFGHLGRFSVRYRETYGESPSTTLRVAR